MKKYLSDKSPLVNKARELATLAHKGQLRKYTEEPYIKHPEAVFSIIQRIGGTPEMQAAALLHDVVEDTEYTLSFILKEFGVLVYNYVHSLTDISIGCKENRTVRKHMDLLHISAASKEAKTIKLADSIHNIHDILKHDQKFALIYMKEKQALMGVLKEGHIGLYRDMYYLLQEYTNQI